MIDAKRKGPLWTIEDVAAYLAVSKRTIERARNRGDLPPAIRIGRAVRYRASAVIAWADASEEAA